MPRDRRRDDHDDDYDDPPRRRYRDDEDDDRPRRRRREDDDPPPRRRYEDDDFDDRPRRRPPPRDDGDDYIPRRRRPARRSRGPGVGVWVGIGVGAVVTVALVVTLVVVLVRGFGASIDYEKYKAINSSDTVESLEKRFGRAEKVDAVQAFAGIDDRFGMLREQGGGRFGGPAPADTPGTWYRWKRGPVQVIVVFGPRFDGKTGPVIKIYSDSDAIRKNAGKDVNNLDAMARGIEFQSVR